MTKQLHIHLMPDTADYMRGEKRGREDGARRYGQADTRFMSEYEAAGYRDGYASTFCL